MPWKPGLGPIMGWPTGPPEAWYSGCINIPVCLFMYMVRGAVPMPCILSIIPMPYMLAPPGGPPLAAMPGKFAATMSGCILCCPAM